PTRNVVDTEGQSLAVIDALERRALEYCLRDGAGGVLRYLSGRDMAGHELFHIGMDSGARRTLLEITGKPIQTWDSRGQEFSTRYDLLRRPTHHAVKVQDRLPLLLERSVYGEGHADENACGRLLCRYDGPGETRHRS